MQLETLFHWSDVSWGRETPGRRASRYVGRGRTKEDIELAAHGRLDTFTEFEEKVVSFIIEFNNHHVLDGYDADPDMVAAGIARVPHEIFEWGLNNRGSGRVFNDDLIRFKLMPREKVRVFDEGINFEGISYTSPELRPLQDEAGRRGRGIFVWISHDFRADRVFWHDKRAPNGFIVVPRSPRYRWVDGLTFEEAAAVDASRGETESNHRREEDRRRAERNANRRANKAKMPRTASGPRMTKVQARKAKAAEREAHRQSEMVDKHAGLSGPTTASPPAAPMVATGNVVPLHPVRTVYRPPSLEEVDGDEE